LWRNRALAPLNSDRSRLKIWRTRD
jgi:hypothetical protein